jgi:general secretion pathway protein G
MKNSRFAFTMIELIFVIVVLGILASVAIPKFAVTRNDAQISKGRADISAIRSAIVNERQVRLIKGQSGFINSLSSSSTTLFDGNGTSGNELLMYGVTSGTGEGHWSTTDTGVPYDSYVYKVGGSSCAFSYYQVDTTVGGVNYKAGTFVLNASQAAICSKLVD